MEPREERPIPSAEDVKVALLRFSELIGRMHRDDGLLRNLPFLMGRIGDLRRLLFEYEVRGVSNLLSEDDQDEPGQSSRA